MMIKANGEYLDFNGDIEIESQIKLFEEISTSNGEFSYDIEIQDNGYNRKILGIPRADTVKIIYQEIPSEIIDDTGQSIFMGKLQVNRIQGGFITSTFFAGNTEWFALLSEPMSSLPLYRYDVDLTEANIQASWAEDSGIVFPILDAGAIVTRSYQNLKIEDFVPCFYVKTLFSEIFLNKGIKINGDLIDDSTFNKLVIASNNRSQDDVNNRSVFANKSTVQTGIDNLIKITFPDDSTLPFFDGSANLFSSSRYTADARMIVDVSVNVNVTLNPSTTAYVIILTIGGRPANINRSLNNPSGVSTLTGDISVEGSVELDAGEYIEIFGLPLVTGTTEFAVNSGTVKITPTYIYKAFGSTSASAWTQGEFVSNILKLFNVLPSYNVTSKTLTLDLFNNIKNKPYVDISQEVTVDVVDFSEFISNYGKNNYFSYQESEDEDLLNYNISNFISYGSGNITVNNDYISDSFDAVTSDFTAPTTYLNGVFSMSMEKINFAELEDILTEPITSITNSSGVARFNITNADSFFEVGDLVRIDTEEVGYNGDWVINAVTSTYITVRGLTFGITSTGNATRLRHKFTSDDNVYLFINTPNLDTDSFSRLSEMYLGDSTTFSNTAMCYFNLIGNDTLVNNVLKQSLSFGGINNPLSYQRSLLDTYWPLFSRVLNNPVSLTASGYLKRTTFEQIKTFLRPIRIETEDTTNLYYLNRNRGYKGSERPCELELIKLN